MSVAATKDIKNPRQLYRDCLKLAQFIAARDGGNLEGMRKQVRLTFEANRFLTDSVKIAEAKEA